MIEVENVRKRFGTKVAVDDVSFVAPPGAVTGFVGPNGAGKSTVLRMIAGLTRPDSGRVTVAGEPFRRATRPAATMGVFLSAEWIPSRITARGLLGYVCETQALPRSRVDDALALVGLSGVASRPVRSYSLGMRQRLGIAAATIGRPDVLLLDEPVNGLDPEGIHWFREFIATAAQSGTTVLLSSHHMSELALIADRVVMIENGCLVAQGPLAEFVAAGAPAPVYLEAPDLPLLVDALARAGWASAPHEGGIVVHGASALEVGRVAFAEGGGASHLSAMPRSLEDTYFELLTPTKGRSQ
jgi:ABC-2 type transport system ATP-binding protein